jgi:hypothetical protein
MWVRWRFLPSLLCVPNGAPVGVQDVATGPSPLCWLFAVYGYYL